MHYLPEDMRNGVLRDRNLNDELESGMRDVRTTRELVMLKERGRKRGWEESSSS